MKYEKIPTEDYDDDAQELSVELATNVDSDEERDIDIVEEGCSSTNNSGLSLSEISAQDDSTTSSPKKGKFTPRRHEHGNPLVVKKKRSKWVRHLHIFLFLLFTAVVVFTFLPSAVKKLIVWRHNKLYGGSCHDDKDIPLSSEDGEEDSRSDKKVINLLTAPSLSHNPKTPYIQLSTLPSEYIPSPTEKKPRKHLIFIGDIHGMLDEFQELMKKLESKGYLERAHIVLTGDFISKGPDSVPLLDTLIAMNVSCVRGNHEDEVMRVYWKLQRKSHKSGIESDDEDGGLKKIDGGFSGSDGESEKERLLGKRETDDDSDDDDKDEQHEHTEKNKKHKNKDKKKKKHRHRNKHRKKYKHSDLILAKSLRPHHAAFIDACPLILKLDNVPKLGDVAVVHAGMMPGVDLEHQKPSVLMNVRTFVKKRPTPGRKGLHWNKMWNEFMSERPAGQKSLTVVYGHDARRGLELRKYTKGLDTNCVRGGRLTALVVEGGKNRGTTIVSVKCRKYLD